MHCRVVACLAVTAIVLCCTAATPAKQPWDDPFEHLEQLFTESPSARQPRPRVAQKQHSQPTDIEFDLDAFGGDTSADGKSKLTQFPPDQESDTDDLGADLAAPERSIDEPFGSLDEANDSVDEPQVVPEQVPARPRDALTSESADRILPGPHVPPSVNLNRQARRGGYSQQPLTLAGILDDDDYHKRVREEEYCRHIWACAGGRNQRCHQRCLRDWRHNRTCRRGVNGGGHPTDGSSSYPFAAQEYPPFDAAGGYVPIPGPQVPIGGYPAEIPSRMSGYPPQVPSQMSGYPPQVPSQMSGYPSQLPSSMDYPTFNFPHGQYVQ